MSDHPDEKPLGIYGWLNRVLVVLIILAVVTGIGINYLPLIRQNQRMREEVNQKREEVARLEAELRRLQGELRAIQNDPRTLERKVRELGFAKPGETVVTFQGERR
jgi:cell division protein FtsB